jgi:hypothetical protein
VALGRLLKFGHPATRRWGPHPKLESRPNPPLNGFSNGLSVRGRGGISRMSGGGHLAGRLRWRCKRFFQGLRRPRRPGRLDPPCSILSRIARKPSPSSPARAACWASSLRAGSRSRRPVLRPLRVDPVLHEALAAWSVPGMVRPVRAVIGGYSIGELAARRRNGAVGRPSAKDCSPHPKQTYLSRSRTSGSGALTGLVID